MSKRRGQNGDMKIIKEEKNQKLKVSTTPQPSTDLRPAEARPANSPAPAGEGHAVRLEWWESLTPGERKLICSLMRMLRGAKRSQLLDVARAAAKWERGIGCFIKVRLINDRKPRVTISCRSVSRSQSGAFPSRG